MLCLALLGLALLLLVLDMQGVLGPAKGLAQAALQPVEQRMTQTRRGVGEWWNSLLHLGSQRARITDLEQQLAQAQARVLQLEAAEATNLALGQQLGILQTYGWTTVQATVVQINADNGRRMARIAQGRVDGIAVGMAVLGREGGSPPSLIGVVDRVYAQSADVLLITDGAFSLGARTQSQVAGLVVGQWQRGSRIRLEHVDRDLLLTVNDVVVSAGLSKGRASETPMAYVPANIPIGVVTAVVAANREQSAEVRPFVDPDRVREAWVITGEKKR